MKDIFWYWARMRERERTIKEEYPKMLKFLPDIFMIHMKNVFYVGRKKKEAKFLEQNEMEEKE